MASEMVDRIAEALHGADRDIMVAGGKPEMLRDWGAEIGSTRQLYRRLALAALEAAREPNEAMLDAARDWSSRRYGMPVGSEAATGCFQTMIDAALEDVPPAPAG